MTALLSTELVAADEFLHRYHRARPRAGNVRTRLGEVRAQIAETGTYEHTRAELAYGARIALRDSDVYTDGIPWRGLLVRDLRLAATATEVATGCVQHLRFAASKGRIRPTVTIFAPDSPRLINEHLIRYAGYAQHGQVMGDRSMSRSPRQCARWAGVRRPRAAPSTCCRSSCATIA
ncbi:hypothetical protein ALI144C_43550 [Actinosynnema sp. ALI-1.44]|nr:nitric oxide synthase oxygenase [Actinosynnema sp. ALI-1.44]ONI72869.1 hypothetical protein ALI144C_43550 [Actinosynnema sp. ALI-1.44]